MAKAVTNMFDPTTFTEGGGFSLKGLEGVVVGSLFKRTNWARKDGTIPTYKDGAKAGQPMAPSTVWELAVKLDDQGQPITVRIGASGVLMPSHDGVTIAKDEEGPYLVHPKGSEATFNKLSGAAALVESLVNASFDFATFNAEGVTALEGYRLAFEEIMRRDKDGKEVPDSAVTIVTKVVHGPGKSAKVASKATGAGNSRTGKQQPTAVKASEVEVEEEVDAETVVTEIISEILADESPLAKARVSMKVNKVLTERGFEQDDRMAALKLATSDEFLAAGPWAYDKKSLAAL